MIPSPGYRILLSLALILAASSCGGGTDVAGAGGSGIGGTGITTVSGNVSRVVARAEQPPDGSLVRRMLAVLSRSVADAASAQSASLAGIKVTGGGRTTTTDGAGGFDLEDVAPSSNFVLTFVLPDKDSIPLPLGAVPPGSRVRVSNVVLYADQGSASAGQVDVEEHHEDDGTAGEQEGGDDNQAENPETGDNDVEGASEEHSDDSGPPEGSGEEESGDPESGGESEETGVETEAD